MDEHSYGWQFLQESTESVNQGNNLSKKRRTPIPDTWMLLDNQSTADIFYNKKLLTNVRKHHKHLKIHCNAGVATTNMVGELRGYGTVWYFSKGIANILSLSRVVAKGHHVTYDSQNGNEFTLTKSDGKTSCTSHVFKQSERGLYFMDTTDTKNDVTLVNTVDDNRNQ